MEAKSKTLSSRMSSKERLAWILLVLIFLVALAALSFQSPQQSTLTRTAAHAFAFEDLTGKKAIGLVDLHVNDIVTYEVELKSGSVNVWIDHTSGQKMTEVSHGGETQLVVPVQGDYILLVEGNRADVAISLTVSTEE